MVIFTDMAKSSRENETILNPATSRATSLRTTVPFFIKRRFDLRKGDVLRWQVDGVRLVVEVVKQPPAKLQ